MKALFYYKLFIFVALLAVPNFAYAKACADKTLVAFGDSLTAGFGLGPGEGFPEQLQKVLADKGNDIKVVNAGVSGDTTSSGLARLDWSLGDKADAVILELGANDALRGIPPDVSRNNLEKLIVRMKEKNIKVLMAGMLAPPNMGEAYGEAFNPIYADLAKKHDVALYPFFLDGVAAQPELNLEDGIHPTAEGISIIVGKILPSVEALLSEVCGKE